MQCPICKKDLPEAAAGEQFPPFFPFCSERCRLIDLGRWLDGKYQVPAHRPREADHNTAEFDGEFDRA